MKTKEKRNILILLIISILIIIAENVYINFNTPNIEEQISNKEVLLGTTDVHGEGIIININDGNDLIHQEDIVILLDELKNAGAEAIEINGQRIVPTSSITCEGNIIKINGERVGSPFVIRAIGSQSLLYGGLSRVGSILDAISEAGNTATITKVDNITIPKYSGVIDYEYLKEAR